MPTNKIVKKMRNKLYFIKMLISFVVLSIIVVITMSMIFSNMYKKSLIDNTAQEYLDSLTRVNVSIENIINQADSLYNNMKLNKDIYCFLNVHEKDMNLALIAQNAATQTKHLNLYIHSICLYNAGVDFFLSTGYTSQVKAETVDESFKKSMMDSRVLTKRIIKRVELTNKSRENVENTKAAGAQNNNKSYVLSILYKEFSMDNKLQDSILINIDETKVQKDLLMSLEGNTMIINDDGSILTSAKTEKAEDGVMIDYIKKSIIARGMEKGTLKYDNKVDTHMVSFVRSDTANWYVVNTRPFSSITQSIRNKEILLNIICITILFVFIGISFLVSSRLYSPIRKITESLRMKMPSTNDNNGEFPLIVNIIEETFNKMNELTHKNDESTVMLKESLLRSLIIMGPNEENEQRLINDCSLKISFDNLIIVLVKLDDYKSHKENNAMIMDTIMSSTISEVLEKDFLYEMVHMYQGEICIFMNFRNSKENSFEDLMQVLGEMKGLINKLTGTTVTIGIGGAANSTAECITAYKKAKDMVKYRFVLGTDRVIYERCIEENLMQGLTYPAELKEKLLITVRLNKKEEFESTLDQIIMLLSKYVYSDAVVILLKLIMDCIEAMNEITERIKTIEFDFDEFNSIFLEFLTLGHAKSWILRLFDEYQAIMEKINSMKDDKYYKIVEETKKFINENYGDINLGVEMLAEKKGYSQKYFSKVFKDISGCYLSDYIRQVRISKAKELLCQEELKINEIFKMTGFVNSSYFYTTFKNEVGMTPAEYKKFYLKG